MSRIVDESFEGTGYEESWTEYVDTGCVLDEDASHPVGDKPPGAGDQCLKAVVNNATQNDAYAYQTKTGQQITYIRGYLFFDLIGFTTNGQKWFTLLLKTSGYDDVCGIEIQKVSGQNRGRFYYYNNGSQSTDWIVISLDAWARIEFRYDIANLAWEWRIDGSTQFSGSLTSGGTRIPAIIFIGIGANTGPNQSILFTELVAWDDAEWPGEEAGIVIPALMFNYKQRRA